MLLVGQLEDNMAAVGIKEELHVHPPPFHLNLPFMMEVDFIEKKMPLEFTWRDFSWQDQVFLLFRTQYYHRKGSDRLRTSKKEFSLMNDWQVV